jgi:hypothetical protein
VLKIDNASAGFNMGIYLGVLLLPLPIAWNLQIPSRKKTGVTAFFAVGILLAAHVPPLLHPKRNVDR